MRDTTQGVPEAPSLAEAITKGKEGVSLFHALPDMGEDEARRADEARAPVLPGGQGDGPDRSVGERDARLDRRAAEDGRALQAEEDEGTATEVFDTGALA